MAADHITDKIGLRSLRDDGVAFISRGKAKCAFAIRVSYPDALKVLPECFEDYEPYSVLWNMGLEIQSAAAETGAEPVKFTLQEDGPNLRYVEVVFQVTA